MLALFHWLVITVANGHPRDLLARSPRDGRSGRSCFIVLQMFARSHVREKQKTLAKCFNAFNFFFVVAVVVKTE